MTTSQGNGAVHKKKSVSCPAGGRNYYHFFFYLIRKYCPFLENKKIVKNEEKKVSSRMFFS